MRLHAFACRCIGLLPITPAQEEEWSEDVDAYLQHEDSESFAVSTRVAVSSSPDWCGLRREDL